MKNNLPVAKTPASQAVMQRREDLQNALPAMTENEKERFLRAAVFLCNTKEIAACNMLSVLNGVRQCAVLGLNPDPVLGQAYLVPYKGNATFIVGYKGMIELARRSGVVSHIDAEVVYENDELDVNFGTDRRIKHRPYYMNGYSEPGARRFAYAVATLKSGDKQFIVSTAEQVENAKKSSASSHSKYSPWNTSPDSMWKKTAVRELSKWIPQTQSIEQVNSWEDKAERGETVIIDQSVSDEPQKPIEDPLLDGDFEVVEDDGISEEEAEAIRQAEIEEANN